ncbi:MAG: DUF433 domain-containing protein [Chromatiaceae bacterium]|nr:DUF433 domain-containing protein [Chromatiaceae bacterium]
MTDWHGRIVSDPDTLFGKLRISGTRMGVAFVLDLLASGWSEARILDSYPHVQQQDLEAVFAFVRDRRKDEGGPSTATLGRHPTPGGPRKPPGHGRGRTPSNIAVMTSSTGRYTARAAQPARRAKQH